MEIAPADLALHDAKPSGRSYRLAAHVYACRCSDYVVLLDLKRDQFFGLSKEDAAELSQCLSGTSRAGTTSALLSELFELGMLVSGDSHAERFDATARATSKLREPSRALIDGYERPHVALTLADIAHFVAAVIKVRVSHRQNSLLRAVSQLSKRHAVHSNITGQLDLVRRCVAAFRNLTPYLFTSNDKCLVESLVLCEFLAYRAIYPHLVIGVSTAPFRAHCWLQLDDVVLNDTPEFVTQFEPILIA